MEFTLQRDAYFHEVTLKGWDPNDFAYSIMQVINDSDAAPMEAEQCGLNLHELSEGEDEELIERIIEKFYGKVTPLRVMQIGRLTIIGEDGDCPYCGAHTSEEWDGFTKYTTCHNDNCDYSHEDVLTKAEFYEP